MKKLFCLLFISTFLTACAPPRPAAEPPENKPMPVEERQAKTRVVSSWELNGAMAVKSPKKSFTATVNWLQRGGGQYQIRMLGPLGSGALVINKSGSAVTIQDGPKKFSSNSADKLFLQQTGVALPVSNLFYWVRGLAAPGAVDSTKRDAYNHLTMLKQAGYSIQYLSFTSVNGTDLPSKIQLTGRGLSIKFIIKHWRV
ncbi:lipoprotein insertase outer membrane protein LolB [Legionella sp. W05-934-2]|uniref:lipoprotein insertase outer membrane protein LolB n=1 Tax=Legionella sp. W05-934-2 TaxID=1198649 RepID=UPI003463845E